MQEVAQRCYHIGLVVWRATVNSRISDSLAQALSDLTRCERESVFISLRQLLMCVCGLT